MNRAGLATLVMLIACTQAPPHAGESDSSWSASQAHFGAPPGYLTMASNKAVALRGSSLVLTTEVSSGVSGPVYVATSQHYCDACLCLPAFRGECLDLDGAGVQLIGVEPVSGGTSETPYAVSMTDPDLLYFQSIAFDSGKGYPSNTVSVGVVDTCTGSGAVDPATSLGTDTYNWGVAVGDFDGDGVGDVAGSTYGANQVYVWLGGTDGVADGTFKGPEVYSDGGSGPWMLVAEDVSNDGHPDLITSNLSSNDVVVWLGKGDGSFDAATSYHAGSYIRDVAVGDFDEDGWPDMVATSASSGELAVFLSRGDGTFHDSRSLYVGGGPMAVDVGDFDGDGHLDIAHSDTSLNEVQMRLGLGDGGFTGVVATVDANQSWGIAAADIDNDGDTDLAIAELYVNAVTVALNDGGGGFSIVELDAEYDIRKVSVGHMDGDGNPDLIVGDFGNDSVSIYLGNGDGSFRTRVTTPIDDGTVYALPWDFDEDGIMDLATANYYGENVGIAFGSCD